LHSEILIEIADMNRIKYWFLQGESEVWEKVNLFYIMISTFAKRCLSGKINYSSILSGQAEARGISSQKKY
jgi:hypothetical protein